METLIFILVAGFGLLMVEQFTGGETVTLLFFMLVAILHDSFAVVFRLALGGGRR